MGTLRTEERTKKNQSERAATGSLSISLDASKEAISELVTLCSADSLDLWWNDCTDGTYPLIGQSRLTTLLEGIDLRHYLIVEKSNSGRVCQALGLPTAMTVEISVNVDQVVVARQAEQWSQRVNMETYSGFNHPAQARELFGAAEASFILWQWVTTGVLPIGYIGQEPPESCHRARSRGLGRDQ